MTPDERKVVDDFFTAIVATDEYYESRYFTDPVAKREMDIELLSMSILHWKRDVLPIAKIDQKRMQLDRLYSSPEVMYGDCCPLCAIYDEYEAFEEDEEEDEEDEEEKEEKKDGALCRCHTWYWEHPEQPEGLCPLASTRATCCHHPSGPWQVVRKAFEEGKPAVRAVNKMIKTMENRLAQLKEEGKCEG